MGCENGRLISPLKKLVKLLVKISTGIATTYKFSDSLCRPTTLGSRRLVFSRALITNSYNRIKFTTPISEGEVICYNIGFFFFFFLRALRGLLLTRNGSTNLFRI